MARSDEYLKIAMQYYVAGRSAVFAAAAPVAGNLFHHGVEMYLKFRLVEKGYVPEQLWRIFGHKLEKLWNDTSRSARPRLLHNSIL